MSTMTATPPMVARIVTSDRHSGVPKPRLPKGTVLARRVSTLLIALLIAFIGTVGIGGTQSASAIDLWPGNFPGPGDIASSLVDKLCSGADDAPPATPGLSGGIFGNESPFTGDWGNKSVTLYEEYGTGGFVYTDDACIIREPVEFLMNTMSNMMFAIVVLIVSITVGIFRWATSPNLMDDLMDPMNQLINGPHGLKETLFLEYLIPIIMISALWVAWQGLAKKRTTDASQGVIWMVVALAASLTFMAHPSAVANHSNKFVNDFTTIITNGVTGTTSSTVGADDVCYLKDGAPDRGNRMAACSLYKAMLLTPWSVGQFGQPFHQGEMKADKTVKFGGKTINDLRVLQIEAQTISHNESVSGQSYDELQNADHDRWDAVRDGVKNDYAANYATWTGSDWGTRFQATLVGVVAAAAMSVLVVTISFATVVLALGMVLLIMLSPLFLLVGVHPGFGRGIAMKWLELLLGTVLKRIVMAAMLAVLVGMYQIIMEDQKMSWFSQISLILALGIGAIIFRKPLLETLNVINLGGSRTGLEQGMGNHGQKAMAAGVGGLAGGVSGAATGGLRGATAGAVRGTTMGSRSGNVMRAGTMGSAAGRRAGKSAAAAKKARKDEKQTGNRSDGTTKPKDGTLDTQERREKQIEQELDKARMHDESLRVEKELAETNRKLLDQMLNPETKNLAENQKGLLDEMRKPGGAGGAAGGTGGLPTSRPGGSGAGPRPQGPDSEAASPSGPAADGGRTRRPAGQGGVPSAPPSRPDSGGGLPTNPPTDNSGGQRSSGQNPPPRPPR